MVADPSFSLNFLTKLALNCPSFRKQSGVKWFAQPDKLIEWKWSDVWPSMVTHTQNLCSAFNTSKVHTHSSEPTPGAVGSFLCCGARGAVGDSVPCSRVSPQSWYWGWRERWLFTPKLKWLDNWDYLGFWGIKKECIFTIVWWLCPHTANTHLCHSHITLQPKTACPLKLSRVQPGQYLDGRPSGKTRLLLEVVLVRPAGGAHPVVCVGPIAPV